MGSFFLHMRLRSFFDIKSNGSRKSQTFVFVTVFGNFLTLLLENYPAKPGFLVSIEITCQVNFLYQWLPPF